MSSLNDEVIVIGGGVIGLAASNALLRAGLRVTSVFPPATDQHGVASRASGAMLGAFGETNSDDQPLDAEFDFRLRAQRRYPEWLEDLCERAGASVHQARGTFVIANNTDVRDRPSVQLMKHRAESAGEPAEYVEPRDVPGLRPSPRHAPGLCLHLPHEHSVDSDQLLDALQRSAGTFASWTHLPDSVIEAWSDGDGWAVKTLGGPTTRAQRLVLCAGARSLDALSPQLRQAAGLPELRFGKGVCCLVSGGPALPSTIRTPNRAFACGIHVVPRAGGLLYLGATNHVGAARNVDQGIQPGELHSLFDEILHQISTSLRETRIEQLRFGQRPITSHGRPIIGATRLHGLSIATGTYRDGMLMAPLVGDLLAAEVLGRPSPANPFPVDAHPAAGQASLVDRGVRDIVAFLQEPRGELPYERAEQLRRYVTALFHMAVDEDARHSVLRDQIRAQLREVPLNETMHTVFRQIVSDADDRGPNG